MQVDFYERAFKAENATYSFDMPAIPRIGEHLTIADGAGSFSAQEILDVQHVCYVGPNKFDFMGIRVLLATEMSIVDYSD